jgi:hypothetical protein
VAQLAHSDTRAVRSVFGRTLPRVQPRLDPGSRSALAPSIARHRLDYRVGGFGVSQSQSAFAGDRCLVPRGTVFEVSAHLCHTGLGWCKRSWTADETASTESSWHEHLPLVRPCRMEVSRRVQIYLEDIAAGSTFIGTGDPDAPMLIGELELPAVWRCARPRTVWAKLRRSVWSRRIS